MTKHHQDLLQTNPTFVSNMREIYFESGEKWLSDLPSLLNKLASIWNFAFERVLPDLSYSFVALVNYQDKQAVIKIAPPEQSLLRETQCLACFQKDSPMIYEYSDEDNALLMEYIFPGKSLKHLVQAGHDDQATQVICNIIRELRLQNESTYPFKHLSDLIKDLQILQGVIDKSLLDKALGLFHDLTINRQDDIVLHGDLHHDNILSCGDGWKIIDPHGYLGEPTAEIGTMIRNPYDCFPTDKPLKKILERRFAIIKDELPYEAERIKAWAFCISVLSAAWTFEGFRKVSPAEIALITTLKQF